MILRDARKKYRKDTPKENAKPLSRGSNQKASGEYKMGGERLTYANISAIILKPEKKVTVSVALFLGGFFWEF